LHGRAQESWLAALECDTRKDKQFFTPVLEKQKGGKVYAPERDLEYSMAQFRKLANIDQPGKHQVKAMDF